MKRRSRAVKKSRPEKTRKRSVALPSTKGYPGYVRVVLTEPKIRQRVQAMAKQINRDYAGRTLHVVGVLENCFIFMSDLVRALTVSVICHFVKAETREVSAGGVELHEILYTPRIEAHGKDVLLVDGLLQSGLTLDHLVRSVLGQGANSVRTAILIEKTDERKTDVETDYVGFETTGKFLVGYGLGYQDQFRNLPFVAVLK
jgi:hypoxanthine phosphoribosyltransferase